jgi:membrane fusion protein, multidrug efflux system
MTRAWARYAAGCVGVFVLVATAAITAACSAGAEKADAPPPPLQVGQENVVVVRRDTILTGPMVSGELRAAQEATVRAEIAGSMSLVAVEEGQTVRRGALLGRIDALPLRDARQSAVTALRSAENQLELARREADRTAQLVEAGAVAPRDLDQARTSVAQVEAVVADARSRLASAENQLEDTVLRAPIDGVVSRRAVSRGDVVSPGTELFTIVDPRSMRLEASVPAADIGSLTIGAPVRFTVRGYAEPFTGKLERINPQADRATRQVPILVSLPNDAGRLVSGLFAEGRVVIGEADGTVVPLNAVNTAEGSPWVLKASGGRTQRVTVHLGLVDPLTERVQIVQGVQEGDVLLRGAAQAITPDTPVQVAVPQ